MAVVSPALTEAENHAIDQLLTQKRWKPARVLLEKLCQHHPEDPDLRGILSCLLLNSAFREHHTAEIHLRQGLKFAPDHRTMQKNLAIALLYQAQFDEARDLFDALLEQEYDAECLSYSTILAHADPKETVESLRHHIHKSKTAFYNHFLPQPRTPSPPDLARKRLRIGYYSNEFYFMQMIHFLYPLLQHHDRDPFELYAYSGYEHQDSVTDHYRGFVDHWVDLSTMNRKERTLRVAADDLDILVATSGNSFDEGMAFFLDRPARLQVNWWISSGASSMLDCFDWIFIDSISAPTGAEPLFTEKLWRLEENATPFMAADFMGEVSPSPALQNGFVTFCSTTRLFRLNPEVIRLWSQILQRLPQSRLIIDSLELGASASCDALQQRFIAEGIAPERLDFGQFNQWDTFRRSDITLDAFPFSAGTSPCQAMYMGHPVITLAGIPSHGRLAASHVTWAGHPEWIAQSTEDYLEKAVALAQDPSKLAQIRQSLRSTLESSPLMDYQGFAQKLCHAYQTMWKQTYAS